MTSSPRTKAAARLAAQREPYDKKGTKYIKMQEHIQIKKKSKSVALIYMELST